MKNQYFGDINDYRKYGLLRILSAGGKLPTAICWMLTESDGGSDGKHVGYLKKPEEYRKFDPELFDKLHECVHLRGDRNVELAERNQLIPGALHYSKILTDDVTLRQQYFEWLKSFAKECELVFFDQDNGMEVASVPYGSKDSSKYLYWRELDEIYKAGHSVLVYQHFPRKDHEKFKGDLFREACKNLQVKDAIMFVTSNVLFMLIPQEKHQSYFHQCADLAEQLWENEIKSAIMQLDKKLIFETVSGEKMTEDQVESVVSILFGWWKKDYEARQSREVEGSNNTSSSNADRDMEEYRGKV